MTEMVTYIGECCREWILAGGFPVGSCGLCGERPTYKREDGRVTMVDSIRRGLVEAHLGKAVPRDDLLGDT